MQAVPRSLTAPLESLWPFEAGLGRPLAAVKRRASAGPPPHAILVALVPFADSPPTDPSASLSLGPCSSVCLGKPCLWRSGARSKRKRGQGDPAQHEHRVMYLLISSIFVLFCNPWSTAWTAVLPDCRPRVPYKFTTAKEKSLSGIP